MSKEFNDIQNTTLNAFIQLIQLEQNLLISKLQNSILKPYNSIQNAYYIQKKLEPKNIRKVTFGINSYCEFVINTDSRQNKSFNNFDESCDDDDEEIDIDIELEFRLNEANNNAINLSKLSYPRCKYVTSNQKNKIYFKSYLNNIPNN
jgi:hypothetical protein